MYLQKAQVSAAQSRNDHYGVTVLVIIMMDLVDANRNNPVMASCDVSALGLRG